ncbi:MAG: aminotransferase class V-fold PLP-dependent enzyme [Coxiellaceae bacterium]|nr:aminotransferase class V-fold PLP-dependent enzyme [Coxiellaceae bacterium]
MRASAGRAVSSIVHVFSKATDRANQRLSGHTPVTLVAAGFLAAVAGYHLLKGGKAVVKEVGERIDDAKERGVKVAAVQAAVDAGYAVASRVPIKAVKKTVAAEIDKERRKLFSASRVKSVALSKPKVSGLHYTTPEESMDSEALLTLFAKVNDHMRTGRTSGTRYAVLSKEDESALAKIFTLSGYSNPLHTGSWPMIQQLHNALTAQTAKLMHDRNAYGVITSGGTSSIEESVKAYVRHAREELGIAKPRIIIPETAHVAFRTAAEKMDVDCVIIPVDPITKKVDPEKMRRAINKDTVLLVGSAPNYPYGVSDDVAAIAAIAQENHIGCHADHCLGGMLTAFADQAGYIDLPVADFRVEGVTSISIDRHKYGRAPKGISEALMRREHPATKYLTHAYFDWSGGLYIKPTTAGSRSGMPIMAAYYLACRLGVTGYAEQTRKVIDCTRALAAACNAVPEMHLCGEVDELTCVVGLEAEDLPEDWSIYVVMEYMNNHLGWELNALKNGFHLCVTAEHADDPDLVATFIKDMKQAIAYVQANPGIKPSGNAKAYGQLDMGMVPRGALQLVGHGYQEVVNSGSDTVLAWLGEEGPVPAMPAPRPW